MLLICGFIQRAPSRRYAPTVKSGCAFLSLAYFCARAMIRAMKSLFAGYFVHRRSVVSTLIIVAVTASGTAAQNASASPPLTRASFTATMDSEFRKLDTNRDQIVTKSEIEANQRSRQAAAAARTARTVFAQIDSDRNGQLSVDEYIRANAQSTRGIDGGAIMGRLDTNRDQKVTLVEYRILTLANFDQIDSDRDGVLTAAEQKASAVGR